MELVSVIIPTHNRCLLLKKAIKSVQNQTYKSLQIIVVDDASTDDTKIMVNMMADARIKYFHVEEPRGGNYARNLGIKNADGKYIAFLDDDDEWLPTKIEEQLNVIQSNDEVGLVYTGAEIIYIQFGEKYIRLPEKKGDLSKSILSNNHIGTTSSVMVKKEHLESVGGFDEQLQALQDYDLWIRLCQITNVGYVAKPLIKYYNYPNTTQITNNLEKIMNSFNSIDTKYNELLDKLPLVEKRKRFFKRYNLFGKRKLRTNNKKEARTFFVKAFKRYPNLESLILLIASIFDYNTIIKIKSYFK